MNGPDYLQEFREYRYKAKRKRYKLQLVVFETGITLRIV